MGTTVRYREKRNRKRTTVSTFTGDREGKGKRASTSQAALTGLRQGELFNLERSNIHGGRILLRPDQTKSGKARVVPVPEDARPWLEELPFPTTYARLRRVWEAARAAVGRKVLSYRDLRHSYASLLVQAGESMTTVQICWGIRA